MNPKEATMVILVIALLLLSGCLSPKKEEKTDKVGDVVPPEIRLINPKNDSFILPGDFIRLNIIDENLSSVLYSVDKGAWSVLKSPYEIDTSSWIEGRHTVNIKSIDMANNTATSLYYFEIDLTPPSISLISPPNDSAMESGTQIIFNISDKNLLGANYSLDNGKPQCLPYPFRIGTTWWSEGKHTLKVNAVDRAVNTRSSQFEFWIDNKETDLKMISPSTRVCRAGTDIVFYVEESTLENITYSINTGADMPWSAPWIISTDGWSDGVYSITIKATDKAGHGVIRTYQIEIDNTPPSIEIPGSRNITVNVHLDARNYSSRKEEQLIKANVSDAHLKQVLYSLNGGRFETLKEPYLLNPTVWRGQIINLTLKAEDLAGNEAEKKFSFNLSFNLRISMGGVRSDISIPFLMGDYTTRNVFSCIDGTENGSYDKIYAFDGVWHTFNVNRPDKFNDLKTITPYMGLAINIISSVANFTATGILPSNWSIYLSSAHSNFVSYPSMNPMRVDRALQDVPWYRVQRWDWQNQKYINMKGDDLMLPGYGYWIYVSTGCDWVVDF